LAGKVAKVLYSYIELVGGGRVAARRRALRREGYIFLSKFVVVVLRGIGVFAPLRVLEWVVGLCHEAAGQVGVWCFSVTLVFV